MRRFLAVLSVAVAAGLLAGCGGEGSGDDAVAGAGADVAGTVTVFAAASLTDAFTEVARAFEVANRGVSVELSFAGSSSLREQIREGAPADVFASANESNMAEVIASGEIASSQIFATNRLQIVVPAGNPAGITGLDDFAVDDLLIGLCAEEVPCGEFGRRVLDAAGVVPAPDTNEADVRSLLTKVEAGELDAGLVYVTDVVSGRDVEGIDVPVEIDVVARYPIGTVTSSGNPAAAAAFVEFVLGDEGRSILDAFGFGRP